MGEMVFIFYFFFEKIWMVNFNRFELVESNGEGRNVLRISVCIIIIIINFIKKYARIEI